MQNNNFRRRLLGITGKDRQERRNLEADRVKEVGRHQTINQ